MKNIILFIACLPFFAFSQTYSSDIFSVPDANNPMYTANTVADTIRFFNSVRANNFRADNQIGVKTSTLTALIHIGAGTATASTAPLKFTSGTSLTTPENGAVEYNGTDLFLTSGGTRYQQLKGYTGTSPSLDFPSMLQGTGSVLTFSDANAVSGDVISVGNPYASGGSLTFSAGCSTSGTIWINVMYWGAGTSDPGASTFKYSIFK
jgi:hypothetical protein